MRSSRKDRKPTIITCLFLLCWLSLVHAQLSDIHFENIGVNQGLSSNFVLTVAQDKFGFIWFGTNNGLNRYDGHNITTFWHDPADSNSVSWDWTESLLVDHAGNLWVGTHGGGLNLFDYETESFIRYQNNPDDSLSLSNDVITTLFEDSKLNIWVGTAYGGLNKFNQETGTFTRYRHLKDDPHSLSDDNVRRIFEDRQGTLWVGTGGPFVTNLGGLNRLETRRGTFTRYLSDPGNPNSLVDNRVWGFYEDEAGTFWVGSWGDGLHQMDREKGSFIHFPNDPRLPEKISSPYLRRKDPTNPGFGAGITSIFRDRSGIIWISAVYGGLDRFDLATGKRQHFEADKYDPNSVGLNWVWSIYEDRQNTLWFASAGNGVYKVLPGAFNHYKHPTIELNINTVFEDSQKELWIGTDKGLFKLDESSTELTPLVRTNGDFNTLARESIQAITQDRNGEIWFGTANGLYRYDKDSETLRRYEHETDSDYSLSHNHITALAGSTGVGADLWIVCQDNILHRFDALTDRFTRYSFLDSLTADWQNEHSILSLQKDSRGKLWMGINAGGSLQWDPVTESLKFFPQVFSWALWYHEDRQGRFWIGSRLYGLLQFDLEKEVIIKTITEKEGLASGRINGILEDELGYLWLGTQDGYLSRFDPNTGIIKNYDVNDGLKKNSFLPGSFARSHNNGFLFGGSNGLTAFDPTAFVSNSYPPEVVISGLLINGKNTVIGEKQSVELTHQENNLAFSFAALHYVRPDKNKVFIMLEGYDDTWQESQQQRAVRYTNLNPGNYIFRVKASSSDGVWSEKEARLSILILPPWWATWWAYILYFLIAALTLYLAYCYQKRRWLLQTSLQLEQEESRRLKELDEFKSRFFANVSHEFRTPLTIIRGLAREIRENPKWKIGERTDLITQNSDRLLQLINQILDLSKLEVGKLEPEYVQGDVVKYLNYLIESFHSLAHSRNVTLSFFANMDSLLMDYDPEKLGQIIGNLLSNALKFTPKYGKVTVSAREINTGGRYLEVTVRDTGTGIPPEKLPYIFDRFYQVDNSSIRQGEGTGLGLALVKELLQLMDGNIWAKSQVDHGTSFTFQLPIVNKGVMDVKSTNLPSNLVMLNRVPLIPTLHKADLIKNFDYPIVLLVEDNSDVIYYLRNCLEDRYQVLEAKNGRLGIEKAYEAIPDLIISDVMMPEMDGFEMCRTLKADERTNHIPVVLLTAKTEQADKMEGLSGGADVYLVKPFHKEELLLRLSNLLDLREKMQKKYQIAQTGPANLQDAFLNKLSDLVDTHLDDPDFGVIPLSRALGLSRVQVHRKLKALTNLSATQYIRSIRLQKAHHLLKNSELTIAEISYQVGFRDPAHFSRSFSQYFGLAPSETRK